MDGLEIVDAHMHLWTPTTHPWVEKVRGGGHPAGNFGECHLHPNIGVGRGRGQRSSYIFICRPFAHLSVA